ncbi:MAG: KilA-N domain-containing protein [Bacteroidetes bacterium]|nr:KilA-N domain-containing protein [Bacteroidota bacterium]
MVKQKSIIVQNIPIQVMADREMDYICITDMANAKGNESRAADIIKNWIRNRYTLEFLGTWEQINNPDFKVVEFDHFRMQAGLNSFVLSVSEWIEKTHAIGFLVKKGRYGGTYAHKDIAFEFGSAISAPFKLYLIIEFQRLKAEENDRLKLNWSLNRTLAKINYRIHTDAIQENIIPKNLNKEQISQIYASEADVLNVALFGKTAKQWRDENPDLDGNIRDYATIEQLLVLANIESLNAEFIKLGLTQSERLLKLNQTAISQMKSLTKSSAINKIIDRNRRLE